MNTLRIAGFIYRDFDVPDRPHKEIKCLSSKALTVSVLAISALCVFGSVAFAEGAPAGETAQAATSAATGAADNVYTMNGYIALAIGFGLGIAAFGGAMGQGRAATAALEGIARNPGHLADLPPMILGLALIESLVVTRCSSVSCSWAKSSNRIIGLAQVRYCDAAHPCGVRFYFPRM